MKISVIIPVYNVAPYLKRCVDSVTAQSYIDLEIILVDDGSKDESPAICDELASTDSRIIVIHKKNAGLSAARNSGIDIASGQYIMFVDSDDWIHPDYVKTLLQHLLDNQCKIAVGELFQCHDMIPYKELQTPALIIPQEEAIPRMLKGEWVSACGKLFERSIYQSVRFPEGRNNEDYAILVYLLEQCDKICYTPDIVYYYFVREGSITHSKLNPHSFDEYLNGIDVYNYCKGKYPQWADLALNNLIASIIKLTGASIWDKNYADKYHEMKAYYLKHKKEIHACSALSWKQKPFLWAMALGKPIHKLVITWYYHVYKA